MARRRDKTGATPRSLHSSVVRRLAGVVVGAAMNGALISTVPSLGKVRHDLLAVNVWWGASAIAFEFASGLSFEQGSGALLPSGGVTSYAVGGAMLAKAGMGVREIVIRSWGLFWLTTAVNAFALVLGEFLCCCGSGPGRAASSTPACR